MPTMIRPKGKSKKIAEALLGAPVNMRPIKLRRKKAPREINEPPYLT